MISNDLAYKQRVVYAGLHRMTDDRQVIHRAYLFWLKKLSPRTFDIKEIVAYMVRYLGLGSTEKKALMVALHAASNRLLEDLPSVPDFMHEGVATFNDTVADEPAPSRSPQWLITNQTMQQTVQYIKKFDAECFLELKQILIDENMTELPDSLQATIATWAGQGLADLQLPEDISEAHCQLLMHELYLLVSEVTGPIEADNIFNKVISNALNNEAASRFNPRSLL